MASLSLRHWWKRMVPSSRSRRRKTDPAHRQRSRLNIEVFEDRCVPSTVTTLDDAGAGSLRQAILDTPSGGTVDFQSGLSGTIVLTTGQLDITKDLNITGPGASVITVSGNHVSRVINIDATFTVAISGLTIADGQATPDVFNDQGEGGGIFINAGAHLNISQSIVSNNLAFGGFPGRITGGLGLGGGIFVDGNAQIDISQCKISNNQAVGAPGTPTLQQSGPGRQGAGGGIYLVDGIMHINSSTVSANQATGGDGARGRNESIMNPPTNPGAGGQGAGSGLYVAGSTVYLDNNTFADNQANGGNGGSGGSGNSRFRGTNGAGAGTGEGAALYVAAGTVYLDNNTLTGNQATGGNGGPGGSSVARPGAGGGAGGNGVGAGISVTNSGIVDIHHTTISNNRGTGGAGGPGGGGQPPGPPGVSGTSLGGGFSISTNQGFLRNTILAGNFSASSPDVDGSLNSLGHNLIGDGTGGGGFDPTDLVGTLDVPIDPLLGPLQDNGGPTQTMALLPGSPAIDAGDNTNAPEFDQRGPGYPRIVNGIIDIGAFEVQQAVAPTVTCSVADSLLWPPNHRLVNVGLSVTVDPPDANVHLLVYANDHAETADAADIAPNTLRVRAERTGRGLGRVYLIVATATNSAGSTFDVCSVVVPHSNNPISIAIVRAEAFFADLWYRHFQTPPPGFRLLGEGPGGGGAPSSGQSGRSVIPGDIFRLNPPTPATPLASLKQESLLGVVDATVPAEHLLSAWASLPVDGYFATSQKENSRLTLPRLEQEGEANGPALDLGLKDERLAV